MNSGNYRQEEKKILDEILGSVTFLYQFFRCPAKLRASLEIRPFVHLFVRPSIRPVYTNKGSMAFLGTPKGSLGFLVAVP